MRSECAGVWPRTHFLTNALSVRFKGLSPEDMLLYQCIARQGNVGIWTKDIRRRTNLGQPQINKILKTLEERGLIKHVKSVQNASRKVRRQGAMVETCSVCVGIFKPESPAGCTLHFPTPCTLAHQMYMLAELEPAKEITGGPWYGVDGKLDASFIEGMQRAVLGFVHSHGPATTADVLDFIEEKQICQLVLQSDDISLLLNNLVYEGSLEGRDDGDGDTVYRLVRRLHKIGGQCIGDQQ